MEKNRHGLLSYQNVACITVPSDERSVEFNQLLSDHYLDHNNGIISWLSNVNKELSSQRVKI